MIKVYYSTKNLQSGVRWDSIKLYVPENLSVSQLEEFTKNELLKKDLIGKEFSFSIFGAFSEMKQVDKSETSLQSMFLDRQRLAAIVENSEDAILGIDLTGNIQSWNSSAEKMFGYRSDEVLGQSDLILVPENKKGDFHRILEVIKSGESIDHYETERVRKDGSLVLVSISVSPIRNSRGEIVGAAKISRDITEKKSSEKDLIEAKVQAENANSAKTLFIANVSHEIRTPIGVMMGFAELLQDESLSDSERQEAIGKIIKNGKIVSSLINEILDLTKIESGKLKIENNKIDLPLFLEDMISSFRIQAKEKELDLQLKINTIPQFIETDSVRLRQILNNLLANAIKFTKRGCVRLEVSSKEEENFKIVFKIIDSGIGVAKDEQKNIFSRYVQADSSITRRFGGVGLGLALSRELATALKGSLSLETSKINEGSTFRLEISPKNYSEISLSALDKLAPQMINNIKILIIDDSADNCLYLKKILEKRGAITTTAENGKEGSAKALSGDYDLVLMDIQMPIMDGYTALINLKQKQYNKPVIALTAGAMREDQEKCLKAGFSGFLTKPVKLDSLVGEIVEQLKK